MYSVARETSISHARSATRLSSDVERKKERDQVDKGFKTNKQTMMLVELTSFREAHALHHRKDFIGNDELLQFFPRGCKTTSRKSGFPLVIRHDALQESQADVHYNLWATTLQEDN
jgi:esterase/lipase superfamily enzyme